MTYRGEHLSEARRSQDLWLSTIPMLAWRNWGNYWKTSVGIFGSRVRTCGLSSADLECTITTNGVKGLDITIPILSTRQSTGSELLQALP